MTRPIFAFAIYLMASAWASSSWAQSSDGQDCLVEEAEYLSLDFWTFDQDPVLGWRSLLSIPGCQLAAADLVANYHRALRDRGQPVIVDHPQGKHTLSEDGEIFLLYWHEGQLRAFEGQTQRAIELFRKSIKPDANDHFGWNEYALASIAFLESDIEELKRQRDLLAPKDGGTKINLGVVDGLIACFGQSYADAYGSRECNRRPTE